MTMVAIRGHSNNEKLIFFITHSRLAKLLVHMKGNNGHFLNSNRVTEIQIQIQI